MRKDEKVKRVIASIALIAAVFSETGINIKAEPVFNDGVCLFVSPGGSDSNDGSDPSAPFKTISKAQARAQLYKNLGSEQITIYLREGTYTPFSIEGSQKSGSADCRIVYENYPGEKAVISNGIYLNGNNFSSVTDTSVLSKIDASARGAVLQYDLSGYSENWILNKINFGEAASIGSVLYLDGETMDIARWPDSGYINPGDAGVLTGDTSLRITAAALRGKLLDEKYAWIGGYFSSGWSYETDRLTVGMNTLSWEDRIASDTSRISVFNALGLLSAPNEWYIDADAKMLYFYPPYDINSSSVMLSTGKKDLISMKTVSYVTVRGLTLEGTQGYGINASDCRNIAIENNEIRDITLSAMALVECYSSDISGNRIHDMGCGGISLGQFTTRNDLLNGDVSILDNEIFDYSRFVRTYTPAIAVTGVGNTVSRNKIHDAPHNGIMFGFNNNIIENNEIYSILSETDDAGAIYAGRSWVQEGNIIRNNLIHDCVSYDGAVIMGIYLDDMFSGTTITGNIIDGLPIGIFMGGGHFNKIENNVISDVRGSGRLKNSIYTDSRGTQSWFGQYFEFPDKKILSNCSFIKELMQVNYLVNPAYEQYPELLKILEKDYRQPQGTVIKNNISYKHAAFRIVANVLKNGQIENNLMFDQNPGFADPVNYDFSGANIAGFSDVRFVFGRITE